MQHLILGGARSGKSRFAKTHAEASRLPVTLIATGQARDAEMAARIARHQAERPANWQTVEEPLHLAAALQLAAETGRCVLVDCLTLWLMNLLEAGEAVFAAERAALLALLPTLPGEILFVSNEIGLGVIPLGELSRRFVDEAGWLNQDIARLADNVTFIAAGLPLALKTLLNLERNPMTTWWQTPVKALDESARKQASQRQNTLTKPPGSLGRLEEIALQLAAMQGRAQPQIKQPSITVFAGDHGVVAEGVAAFPQAVTQQMLANFVAGGAAISVLAKAQGARLEVVDVGTLASEAIVGVVVGKAGLGTANLAREAAMRDGQLTQCLDQGRLAVQRALAAGADIFIGGEMGIGNTTPAAAIGCALLGLRGTDLAGPGTGLDASGVLHKAAVIDRALALHGFLPSPASGGGDGKGKPLAPATAIEILRCVGGFEIAALTGAYIACAQAGLPVLVDGYITTAAALAACRMNSGVRDWLIFAHASAEPGHTRLLAALDARPLLQLGMRLGEGSGAAMALPLLRLACELHAGMATFAEAGVQGG